MSDKDYDAFFGADDVGTNYQASANLREEGYVEQLLTTLNYGNRLSDDDEIDVASAFNMMRPVDAERLAHRILLGDKSALVSSIPAVQDGLNTVRRVSEAMGPSWDQERKITLEAVRSSINEKISKQNKASGKSKDPYVDQITKRIGKRVAERKLSTKNPQQILDALYRELASTSGLNPYQRYKLLGAVGRGPLGKADAKSRGFNSAMLDLVKKNGVQGVRAAASILSLLGGKGMEGLRFDKKGNPTNLRSLIQGTGKDVSIPGSVQGLIKDDLTVISREAARLMAADRRMTAEKALSQALQNIREGKALTVKRQVTVKATGKRVMVGGDARKKRQMWISGKAPISIPDTANGIRQFEDALSRGLSDRSGFASAFVSAIASSKSTASNIRSLAKQRQAAARQKIARKETSAKRVSAATSRIKDPFAALANFQDFEGTVHKSPIRAYAAIRKDLDYYKRLLSQNGPDFFNSFEGQAIVGRVQGHLSLLRALSDSFGSKEYRNLTSKERGAAWFATGDPDLKRAVTLVRERRKNLSQDDKNLLFTVASLAGTSKTRGLMPMVQMAEDIASGKLQFRTPREKMTTEQLIQRDAPKFRAGLKKYNERTSKLFEAIKKGKFDEKIVNHLGSEETPLNVSEYDFIIQRSGGRFAGKVRNQFLRGDKNATSRRKILEEAAGKLVDNYKKAIATATSSPGIQSTEAARAAGLELTRVLPSLHRAYLTLGGEDGVILTGRSSREIRSSAIAKPAVIIKQSGSFLANSPAFMGTFLSRFMPKVAEERYSTSIIGPNPEFAKYKKEILDPMRKKRGIADLEKEEKRLGKISETLKRRLALVERRPAGTESARKKKEEAIALISKESEQHREKVKALLRKIEKTGYSAAQKNAPPAFLTEQIPSSKPTVKGTFARLAVLLSGEGAKYGLYGTREGKQFQRMQAQGDVSVATGAANQALQQLAADIAANISPAARKEIAKQERADARAAKKAEATAAAVDQSAAAIATAAGESVVKEAKKGRAATGTRAAAATRAAQEAAVPAIAAGGAGGGGGGRRGRRTAVAPGGQPAGVPPIGGKNVSSMNKNAAAMAQLFGALSTIAPVSPKKLSDLRATIRGLAEMMAELRGISGGKITTKGLAAALGRQAAVATPIMAAGAGGAGVGRGATGTGGGGGGGGGSGRFLPGFMPVGGQDIRNAEKEAARGIERQSGILGRFVDQIKFGFSQQIVGQISQGVGSLLSHLQGGIIGFNAQLENSAVAFQTLFENEQKAMGATNVDITKASDQADTLVKSIQQFANVTPFRFPELVESARRMRAFGFETKEIMPNLQIIGDAVAALGGEDDKLNRITYALGQMKQSGRVYQNDMMQLANAGIAGYELLSKAVMKQMVQQGEATISYYDSVKKRTVTITKEMLTSTDRDAKLAAESALNAQVNRFVKLGKEGARQQYGISMQAAKGAKGISKETVDLILNQGPVQAMRVLSKRGKIEGAAAARKILEEMSLVFGGGMEKLSRTFQGALSTLQDTSQYMVAVVTKPIYDGLRDVMYDIGLVFQSRAARTATANFASQFSGMLDEIAPTLQATVQIFQKFGEGVIRLFTALGQGGGSGVFAVIGDGIRAISELMRIDFVRAAAVAALAMRGIALAFNTNPILLGITAVIAAFGVLSKEYAQNSAFRGVVDDFAVPMQRLVREVQSKLVPALQSLASGAGGAFFAELITGITLAMPLISGFIRLLNIFLELLTSIPFAVEAIGASLAILATGKLFGKLLFGSAAKFGPAGELIKAPSGGALGGLQKLFGSLGAFSAGTIASRQAYQMGAPLANKARTAAGELKIQKVVMQKVVDQTGNAFSPVQRQNISATVAAAQAQVSATAQTAQGVRNLSGVGGSRLIGVAARQEYMSGVSALATRDTPIAARLAGFGADLKSTGGFFKNAVSVFKESISTFARSIGGAFAGLRGASAARAAAVGLAGGPLRPSIERGIGAYLSTKGAKNVVQESGGFANALKTGAGGLAALGKSLKDGLGLVGKSTVLLTGFFALFDIFVNKADVIRTAISSITSVIGGLVGFLLGGPIGAIIGSMLGSAAGGVISDAVGRPQFQDGEVAGEGVEMDMTQAQMEQEIWNNALTDGKMTFAEMVSIAEQIPLKVDDIVTSFKALNPEIESINFGIKDVLAALNEAGGSLSAEEAFTNAAAPLGLNTEEMQQNMVLLDNIQSMIQKVYENKLAFEFKTPIRNEAGEIVNNELANLAAMKAQAEIVAAVMQAGPFTNVDQLNQMLDTLASRFMVSKEQAEQWNLLINGAEDSTEGLSRAIEKLNEKLSFLKAKFNIASGALQNRIQALFDKRFREQLEKAKEAFLATQEVIVEGTTWNLKALKDEIEEQEKKNRLLAVEKNLRDANRNIEMARLALYDASIDPLEAAARMREAEEAKTDAVKQAALERKRIALDEAMTSEPVTKGLEDIDEKFEAMRMKFQEEMQRIMLLLENGKITGEEAIQRIKDLYGQSFASIGDLDAELAEDAANFGESFLGSWTKTIEKFIKLADKIAKLVKKIKQLQNSLNNPGTTANDDDPGGQYETPPGSAGNGTSTLGGRPYDNWRGHGVGAQMEKQVESDAAGMQVTANKMTLGALRLRFMTLWKEVQDSAKKMAPTGISPTVWGMTHSNALKMFLVGAEMRRLFATSMSVAPSAADSIQKQFEVQVTKLKSTLSPLGKYNPVAGFASGGTIMGPGIFRVGEAGTETMQVTPYGVARVFPRTYRPIHGISAAGGSTSGAVNASVIINNPTVRNDQDIRKLAEEVSRAQRSLLRSSGVGRI